jgi:predicted dehydrogenase
MSNEKKLRVAFVGAGRRMRNVYFPVVKALSGTLDPVGCSTRTRVTGEATAKELGIPWYPDTASLIKNTQPDLVALCLPPSANVSLALEVILHGRAVMMETPVSPSLSEGYRLLKVADSANALVGIAEQKPFMPWEQFKHKLIVAGVLGKIRVAQNDFRSYDYHAIAQLRAYNQFGSSTCKRVRCLTFRTPISAFTNALGQTYKSRMETWDLATIETKQGQVLIHNFSDAYKSVPFRIQPTLKIFGESGTLIDGVLSGIDSKGLAYNAKVNAEADPTGKTIRRLTVQYSSGEIIWENPFSNLDLADDQIGLACHFEAMRLAIHSKEGAAPLYSLREAIADLEVMAAMRISAKFGGATVTLPLNLTMVALSVALSPLLWPRALAALWFKLMKGKR